MKTLEERRAYNRDRQKRYRANNPEYAARCVVKSKEWRAANLTRHRDMNLANWWKYKGMPTPTRPRPECCELCGGPATGAGRLHLDHDHSTGKFRGWLCSNCNTGLGKLGDSIAGLLRAMDYLKRTS